MSISTTTGAQTDRRFVDPDDLILPRVRGAGDRRTARVLAGP